MALTDKLSAIGSAIREKTGKSDLLTLDQMPTEIAAIETGGGGDSGAITNALLSRTFENVEGGIYENEDVEYLGAYAFAYVNNLKKLSLPNVTSAGNRTFANFTPNKLELPALQRIDEYCFQNGGSRELILPNLEEGDTYCFSNIESYYLYAPKWKEGKNYAINQSCNNLIAAELGWETTSGQRLLYSNKIRAIHLPNLKQLGTSQQNTFYGTSYIRAFNFPVLEKVNTALPFPSCTNLKAIDFGPCTDLSAIQSKNCLGQSTLETLVLRHDGVVPIGASIGTIIDTTKCSVYVPSAKINLYKQATNYSSYPGIFKAIEDYPVETTVGFIVNEDLTTVDETTYNGYRYITGLLLPNVTSVFCDDPVNNNCFKGCESLAWVDLPNATSITGFANCTELRTVRAPKLERVGSYAFWNCTGLDFLDFPETMKQIGDYAFGDLAYIDIVLRSPEMVQTNNSPFYSSTGYLQYNNIYVPAALVSEYQAHPNWNQMSINPIEGSKYEEV